MNSPKFGIAAHVTAQQRGSESTAERSSVDLFGCLVDNLSMSETVAVISELVRSGHPHQHVVVNVDKIIKATRQPELRRIINDCSLVNVDGMPVVWAARLLGKRFKERVAGVDLFLRLMDEAAAKGWRVFLLGAQEDVVSRVRKVYEARYPHMHIVGHRNGYWTPTEEDSVVQQIRDAQPDLLFVALSSPRKEEFIAKNQPDMRIPFAMGVGGSFDIAAGRTKRAPLWMQEYGLEWFYRFLQEPRRLFRRYFIDGVRFLFLVAEAAWNRASPPRSNRTGATRAPAADGGRVPFALRPSTYQANPVNKAHRATFSAAAMCVLMLSAAGASAVLKPTAFLADQLPKFLLEEQIPRAFGTWRVDERTSARVINPQAETLLNKLYSQLLSRTYVDTRTGERIMLSIAYGANQSDAMQVHIPDVCYPAQGFEVLDSSYAQIGAQRNQFPVKRLITRMGNRSEPLTYWTTVGNAVVVTGTRRKAAQLSYGFRGVVPDGLIFRVSGIDADTSSALALQKRFVEEILQSLPEATRARMVGGDPS